jgi:hypothetical protein
MLAWISILAAEIPELHGLSAKRTEQTNDAQLEAVLSASLSVGLYNRLITRKTFGFENLVEH